VLDVEGEIHIEVCGDDLTQLNNEPGGHRLQRVPPTERKGRVHTSTVTVAVINSDQFTKQDYSAIDPKDLKIEWYSGTGAGGQHRNKHQNSIRLTHLPTGHTETSQCRSRQASQTQAMNQLVKALQTNASYQQMIAKSVVRKAQTGSGMRGDKVRTYRFQDNIATDHRNGNKVPLSKVMEGNFDLLW
jgi:peptide chain release factor 1